MALRPRPLNFSHGRQRVAHRGNSLASCRRRAVLHSLAGAERLDMDKDDTFDGRLDRYLVTMTTAQQRVARATQASREELLIASVPLLAEKASTSEAAVSRTIRLLQELAARQQHPLLLSHLRHHMHGLEQANRIIWAIPRAPLRSLLLICCAFNCRVSTQTTGSPAAIRPLTSHCYRAPASIPTRP